MNRRWIVCQVACVVAAAGSSVLAGGGKPAAPEPADLGRMRAQLGKLAEEIDELKGENDFLNGEVARYVQKNKELTAKLASLSES